MTLLVFPLALLSLAGARAHAQGSAPETDDAKAAPQFVSAARAWLAEQQGADGRWPEHATPPHRRLEAEALAALALASGTPAQESAARRAVHALAAAPQRAHEEFGRALWVLAATRSGAHRGEAAEALAVRARVREESRALPALESFAARSTQFRALALLALRSARFAGLADESAAEARLVESLLARRAGDSGMFQEHDFPSRSYAATALACEALAHAKAAGTPGLRWLEKQSSRELLGEVRAARYPRFYVRGRRLFELRAHLAALRLAGSPAAARFTQRLREAAARRLGAEPCLQGYFGKVYGSALLVLCFEAPAR